MKNPSFLMACGTAGLLLGLATQAGRTKPKTPAPPAKANPNVVVLRTEKRVTIHGASMTLTDIARAVASQTGYQITLDTEYEKDKTPYAVLFQDTPLPSVLKATAYATRGSWMRLEKRYHLRPQALSELKSDMDRFEAICTQAEDYLASVKPEDLKTPGADVELFAFRDYLAQYRQVPRTLDPRMGPWKLTPSDRSLGLTYTAISSTASSETTTVQSRWWTWDNRWLDRE